MHRNDAFWIIVIVLFLGVFFQYNRMDGFLHLFSVANTAISSVQSIMGPLSRPRSKILRVAVSRIILSSEASKVKLVGNLVA